MKQGEQRDVNEMAGVHQALGILAGKMDRMIASTERMENKIDAQGIRLDEKIGAQEDRLEKKISSVEKRQNKVEGRQHWYAGFAAAIGSAVSLFFAHKFG